MARVEVVLKGGHAQVEDRYTTFLQDQHGRTFTLNMSRKGGGDAGVPSPTRWTAPLSPSHLRGLFLPDAQYRVTVHPEAAPVHLHIDYDKWISDLQAAQGHHDQTKVDVINHQAQGFDAIRLMENPPPSLLKIIGPGPFPPIEVVEEMANGDDWALGKTDVVPAWFTQNLHDQIVATARQTGLMQTWQLRELAKAERVERKRALAAGDPALAKKQAVADLSITADTKWPQFRQIGKAAGKSDAEISEDWRLHKESLEPVGA